MIAIIAIVLTFQALVFCGVLVEGDGEWTWGQRSACLFFAILNGSSAAWMWVKIVEVA